VDDGGIFSETGQEIKDMIAKLSNHFVVKDHGKIKTFAG
jgi:hypothetical protein